MMREGGSGIIFGMTCWFFLLLNTLLPVSADIFGELKKVDLTQEQLSFFLEILQLFYTRGFFR